MKEDEGIVVDLTAELIDSQVELKKVVVFKKADQIQILDFEEEIEEGNRVTLNFDEQPIAN